MLGDRLSAARKSKSLTQWDLAVALGDRYTQSMISAVERGHSSLSLDGAANAAKELEVSLDWLVSLTDDPTPSPDPGEIFFMPAPATEDGDTDSSTARESPIDLDQFRAFIMFGDSMRPTLPAGSTILVDCHRTGRRDNHIFVYRTAGATHVKRAMRWPRRAWWWCCDNPDGDRVKCEDTDEILGEVCWVAQPVAG